MRFICEQPIVGEEHDETKTAVRETNSALTWCIIQDDYTDCYYKFKKLVTSWGTTSWCFRSTENKKNDNKIVLNHGNDFRLHYSYSTQLIFLSVYSPAG